MHDDEEREAIISRVRKGRTAEDTFSAELELLHYDMEGCKIWSTALSREFNLRMVEIYQTYINTKTSRSPWIKN